MGLVSCQHWMQLVVVQTGKSDVILLFFAATAAAGCFRLQAAAAVGEIGTQLSWKATVYKHPVRGP